MRRQRRGGRWGAATWRPNQYHLIQIHRDRLRIWARRFDDRRRRWIGDTAVSDSGDDWRQDLPIRLAQVAAARTGDDRYEPDQLCGPGRGTSGPLHRVSADLLHQVAEVCRLRMPEATITEVATDPGAAGRPVRYLRVEPSGGPGGTRAVPGAQYPIGICEEPPSHATVTRFVTEVVGLFHNTGIPIRSVLVCPGHRIAEDPAAADRLRDWARGRGVRLVSFAEYQLGDELTPFVNRQAADLAADRIYPSALYVPQRYTELDHTGQPWDDQPPAPGALQRLRRWLLDPAGHLIVILAPFGHGKTFLLRELARQMRAGGDPAVPVLVNLRELEKAHDVDQLVAGQLIGHGESRVDLKLFQYLLREGRIALLFDGFDELAQRVSYARAAEHLGRIVAAARGRAKIVLTSRDHYFRSDAEVAVAVATAYADQVRLVAGRRFVKLADFDDEQIQEFLTRRLGDAATAGQRFELIDQIKDLHGLSRNPRMLDFITRLDQERLCAARDHDGAITAAGLYRGLLDKWLQGEWVRLNPAGARPGPSLAELWQAVTDLALRLWTGDADVLDLADLTATAEILSQLDATDAAEPPQPETPSPDPAVIAQILGSSTLLVRYGDRRFTFVHRSVLEWLVANGVAVTWRDEDPSAIRTESIEDALNRSMSPLMVEFLCDLAGRDAVLAWAERVHREPGRPAGRRANALLLFDRLGVAPSRPLSMSGAELRGQDLTNRQLREADLSRADLRQSRLTGVDLSGADLSGARLCGARLDRAVLVGADLSGADLSGAWLLGADLSGARLDQAVLRRAALVGATIGRDALAAAETSWGCALPQRPPVPRFPSGAAWASTLAYHPAGDLLATGGDDGLVRLWDAATGRQLTTLEGHPGGVLSVAFSPSGARLASGGGDSVVRVWDVATGGQLEALSGHAGEVLSVAFSPDGARLASGGGDSVVRVWDVATGRQVAALSGHAGSARSVAFSPDGARLASGGGDRVVRVWDVATGRTVAALQGHAGGVWSVAFSPDGARLASGGYQVVRVWDLVTGRQVAALQGHAGSVLAVAFSPDGTRLASGGGDSAVRLWDVATGGQVAALDGHPGGVWSVAFSPDGTRLASGGGDSVVRVWDAVTGRQVAALSGHPGEVMSVAFSPDGARLASGGGDSVVRVWDVVTGGQVAALDGHPGGVWSVAFNSAGTRLASGGYRVVRVWDVVTGRQVAALDGHPGGVRSVAFSPDGMRLASGGDDGLVRVWDAATGRQIAALAGHPRWVRSVAFSPDGTRLASGGDDSVVRLWDAATGQQVTTLVPLAGGGWAALLPDLSYKLEGNPSGEYWYTIGACRFEPGDLDPYLPDLLRRLPAEAPLPRPAR